MYRDRRGAAGIEFAYVLPLMMLFFMASTGMGLAFWTLSVLQTACEQAARCTAISSAACAGATQGCDSTSPTVCYVEQVAASLGVRTVTRSEVSVATVVIANVSFLSVSISHAYTVAGYAFTLAVSSSYPQSVSSWGSSPAAT